MFKRLGQKSRSNMDIVRTVVQLYIEKKHYQDGIIILEGMLKGAPASSELNYVAGIAYDGLKNNEMALKRFLKVQPDSQFYENAAIQIAYLYQESENVDKAIAYLTEVIKRRPENPELYLYLGSFYEETEKLDEAVSVLKRGLQIDADNVRLHFRLGVVYDKWGRKEDSIEQMKTVVRLEPDNANALNYLGYTYADLGRNLDEAERLIKSALKLKPEDGYITDSMGWVYYKKGQYQKALQYLQKASELVEDDPVILEHLGDVYLKLNDKAKALEFYRRSLKKSKKEKDKAKLEKKIQELQGKAF